MVKLFNSENTSGDDDDNGEQDYYSDDLLTLRTLLKRLCDLIINRILKEKRARDNALPLEQLIEKNIFNTWRYREERCNNYRGYCFVLKSTSNHYKVMTLQ
jgi:hypothetical protein